MDDFSKAMYMTSRKVASATGVSKSYAHRILVSTCGRWSKAGRQAKMTRNQEIRRVKMAEKMLHELPQKWGIDWKRRVIWTDESYFTIVPNTIGRRGLYGKKYYVQTVKNPKKIMIFLAVSEDGFIFFKIFGRGNVDSKCYKNQILIPMVQKLRDENRLNSAIFMQDGGNFINFNFLRSN